MSRLDGNRSLLEAMSGERVLDRREAPASDIDEALALATRLRGDAETAAKAVDDLRHFMAANRSLERRATMAEIEAARYRCVRLMRPHEFECMWRQNVETGKHFDVLVDERIKGQS